jgi:nucleotide-binding universal stress UspA family protein
MLEKVIVPLDGSSTAEVALPYAEEFVARTGDELILLFVKEANDYRSENILQAYLDNMAQKARDKATEKARTLPNQSLSTDFIIKTKILTGNPADEIINFAESEKGSRIIMATHGQSGTGTRWALGSVANKVVRASSHPITLIRTQHDKPEIHAKGVLHSIVATVDGTKAGEAALPYVKDIAIKLKAEVTFLTVLGKELVSYKMIEIPISDERREAAKEYLQKLVDEFTRAGISAKYVIEVTRGDIAGEIVEYTQKHYIDLIVMAAQGHTGWKYWGIGSVTRKVIDEGNAPVMIVKAADKN